MQLHLDLTALARTDEATIWEKALLASEPSVTVERHELANLPAVLDRLIRRFGRGDSALLRTLTTLLPVLIRGAGVTGLALPLTEHYRLYVEATTDGMRVGVRDERRLRLAAGP